ncbi:anti-sigma regulatory factor [Chroococcidiopsis sp. TS-821]|uniref:ATP-binding protein n=1 Tax=Chroococcidiopsis sp. TS-821 TaxID=1378066 RepID=UPI000CEE2F7C|nr:anti-sigma regulatory factor [Chroococcidiopsis sp. TS-821]PPS41427.1 ATP-binding protein [Chroococcidiopsis sp. TS-821]
MFKKIKLQVNTDLAATLQVISWFEQLNHPPVTDIKIWWQCQTLLQEGFTNIVEHAHRGLPQETPIILEAIRNSEAIEIYIWAFGIAFDLEQKLKELPDIEEIEGERGRGLKIMSLLADEISYKQIAGDRYCLYMKKNT